MYTSHVYHNQCLWLVMKHIKERVFLWSVILELFQLASVSSTNRCEYVCCGNNVRDFRQRSKMVPGPEGVNKVIKLVRIDGLRMLGFGYSNKV